MKQEKNLTPEDIKREYSLAVLRRTRDLGPEGRPGFDWSEFTDHKKAIATRSEKYGCLSVAEAFSAVYGVREVFGKKENVERLRKIECRELHPGDIVPLRILDVNKKGVVFDQDEYKETIVSTVNLYQYPNFKQFIPKGPVLCKVMSKDLNKVYVDPFQPMIDEFIESINNTIKTQANVKNPVATKVFNLRHMRSGYVGNIRITNVSDFCGKDMYMQAFVPGSQITLNIESDFEKWEGKDIDTFITNLAVKPGTTDVTIACSAKEYLRFLGNLNTIQLFKDYCEDNKGWKQAVKEVHQGNITGICNTRNKTGVFVEIPELGITGMVPVPADQLTQYKPGPTEVHITGFDELMRFNREVGQMQHVEPYKIENDVLHKCNLKCTLEFAN